MLKSLKRFLNRRRKQKQCLHENFKEISRFRAVCKDCGKKINTEWVAQKREWHE